MATTSRLGALETPLVRRQPRNSDELPALGTEKVGLRDGAVIVVVAEAHDFPLRQRGRLLGARLRHGNLARHASDSATSNENQGDSKSTSVHERRLVRRLAGQKGAA